VLRRRRPIDNDRHHAVDRVRLSVVVPDSHPALDEVVRLIPEDDPHAEARRAFTRAYLRRTSESELPSLDAEQVRAEIDGLFDVLDGRRDDVVVRAFTPTLGEHGYETHGSIVEFVCDDGPFLVDSVTAALQRRRLNVLRSIHPVVGTVRDESGRLVRIVSARQADVREAAQHYELDRRLTDAEIDELVDDLRAALRDVLVAVRDFEPLQNAVAAMIEYAGEARGHRPDEEVDEAIAYLRWLLDRNFVFLGYREYRIDDGPQGRQVKAVPETGLGILSLHARSRFADPVPLAELHPELADRFEHGNLLVVTKTNRHARVHRDARMDYVGLRRLDESGRACGEARLIGLLTSRAYMMEAASIPLLRQKLGQVLEAEDLIEGSHDFKNVVQLFESFPKDDLLSASVDDLRASLMGLAAHEEYEHVQLFLRRDPLRRNVSVLVVIPRDRFNADLRRQLQTLFLERLGGESIDYRLSLGETGDARIHFTVWRGEGEAPSLDMEALERDVAAISRTWSDRLFHALEGRVGDHKARDLVERWGDSFPKYYQGSTELGVAMADIEMLDRLESSDETLTVGLTNEAEGPEELTRLAVYNTGTKLDLSAMMPLLEDVGLRVVEEVPTRLRGDHDLLIHDFGVVGPEGEALPLDMCGSRIADAVAAGLRGDAESDRLHRLLVTTPLDHHQIAILRAYRTYWGLVTRSFSARYIDDALTAHPHITQNLSRLFEARFSPSADTAAEAAIRATIRHDLDAVASLDEDRILRSFHSLVDATVRTNAFVPGRGALAFKIRSARVPEMPHPMPLYEIFVYGREVQGVHLRGGAVSRGGIRWSVRREDYRTEVLGLMKAQMTKNAVIVPDGAKGGFIVTNRIDPSVAEVTEAYETFIEALLDVTDNLVGGDTVHPEGLRIHDGSDPYLVVAADRGTARLSDHANVISRERRFWLGDAFATGGRTGYDHKALGITARGAWESVRRHFSEVELDLSSDPFAVVGIGDMSGDVFGNGMMLSDQIRLIAAFDHRHIFVDPDPDPATAFAERKRLFELGRSSWADYESSVISEGGGVYSRKAKHIALSLPAMEALGVAGRELTPSELISAILRAPVDLLWIGGIGTYVKASDETDEQVQDRINDAVRVDAAELRCRVVGEGGNLGFTQSARIEFDRRGGRIFTDFIDNSGGVHCSDREVNLKILLGLAVERERLQAEDRDRLVATVAPNVVAAVVYDNFLQAQILAQETARSPERIDAYEDLMVALVDDDLLDRDLERLPSSEEMAERSRAAAGMARPELAVLLAYAKRSLAAALLASDLPDWDHFDADLRGYFPGVVVEQFGDLVAEHPLRRELVATIVANQVVNSEGITFVSRLEAETGSPSADIVRAYRVAREVTGAQDRWAMVESLDGRVDSDVQRELLEGVDELVEVTARWYLARPKGRTMRQDIDSFSAGFAELAEVLPEIGPEPWQSDREASAARLVDLDVPLVLAKRHAYQVELVHAPDIIDVARTTSRSVQDVARVFFRVGQAFRIDWLEHQVDALPARTRWQRWSVQTLDDELLRLRRSLAERVIAEGEGHPPNEAVDLFLLAHANEEGRLIRFMRLLEKDGVSDAASVLVAIRQVRGLT